MPKVEKMSLKSFWEAVEQRLAACSADELRAILRTMAQDTPPTKRQAFLARLKPMPETAAAVQQALRQEDLLADIADLTHELKAEMEQAEYWEERYGWDEYYDEEDSLGPYEEFVEPLIDLFDRTDAVFDYGNLALARAAYQKLFAVLDLEDDYGRRVSAEDVGSVDIGEARARYLRAVYETEPPVHRPQALFEQMRQVQSWFARPRPMLEDIIQISPKPLPDQRQFLADWIAFLRGQNGGDADSWLREAVRLSQGTRGQVLSWCLDVAQQRVNAIVGNQHRRSYPKAAVLIAACAEVLRLRGRSGEAGTLLDDVRNRFPRHRAFQAELKAALGV